MEDRLLVIDSEGERYSLWNRVKVQRFHDSACGAERHEVMET